MDMTVSIRACTLDIWSRSQAAAAMAIIRSTIIGAISVVISSLVAIRSYNVAQDIVSTDEIKQAPVGRSLA